MKATAIRTLITALAIVCIASNYFFVNDPKKCGEYRQNIKTASDSEGIAICMKEPQNIPAEQITCSPLPKPFDRKIRNGWEHTLVYTEAIYRGKKQEADMDIHLILTDLKGNPFDAEIPCDICVSNQDIIEGIKAARITAVSLKDGDHILIMGIPFYDKLHGSKGASPIGLEFHPIISLTKK